LSESGTVDPHLQETHRDLAASVREFGERHLRAVAQDEKDPVARAREVGALLGAEGLLARAVPAPFGSADARSVLIAREGLAYFSLLAEMVFSAQGLASQLLESAGTEIQRRRWLRSLASGAVLGTVALAEPDAGSDLSAARCVAETDGPLFRLSGVKSWVTLAGGAGVYVVLARGPGTEKADGLSLFLVDGEADGVAVQPIEAIAALPVGELRLNGASAVRLGAGTRALRQVSRSFEALRPGAAGAACGLAARALDEAVRHGLARRQFGQALAGFQATKMTIADMYSEIEAARCLARHAAWLGDAGAEEAGRAAGAARLAATRAAERAVDRALQLHGAQGLVRGSTVERLFREARALRLREGTTEMVQLDLAETILRENR
jgi:alkylation response protein AidB-like acyl-CoA dehydrogenase